MRSTRITLSLVCSLAVLGACQFGAPEELPLEAKLLQQGYIVKGPVSGVQAFKVNGWNYLDRKNVILWASVRRPYLVTTRHDCSNLLGAEFLAFSTTVGHLTRFEKLIVNSSSYTQTCLIDQIQELERIELAD